MNRTVDVDDEAAAVVTSHSVVSEHRTVMVLSGGDSEGVPVAPGPQQQVPSLGLSLEQKLRLQA